MTTSREPAPGNAAPGRTSPSADNRRDDILAAAARCIARRGIRGLRMSDVGREAGVSAGLLYYHFADRDGLLAATLAHVNDRAAVGPSTVAATEACDRRGQLITNLVAEIADQADIRDHAIAWHEIGATAVFEQTTAGYLAVTDQQWQARIAATLIEIGMPPTAASETALAAVALVDGLTTRWLGGRLNAEAARATLRHTLDSLIPLPPDA